MITETKVTQVQVYRRSVSVTRCGTAKTAKGRNLLYVAGMTRSAQTDTFRLRFPENIRAINIQIVNRDDLDAVRDMSDPEIFASRQIQKQVDEVDYQIQTCTMMMELRKTNGDFSARTDVSVDAQERYLTALPEQLLILHKRIEELTETKEKLLKELEKTLKEEEKPLIMAELYAEEEGNFPFELQYQENAGSWRPKYEIHFTGEKDPLSVSMKAQILQSSGEDWNQVKVTLYTGNPSVSHDLPKMSSIQLSLYETQTPKAKTFSRGVGRAMAMEDACVMEEAAAAPMMMSSAMNVSALKMAEAEVAEEETMTAFVLPDQRDILSDTDGNIAELKSFEVKAAFHVLCIPKVSDKCFLTAEIVSAEWPLPSANAAVYLRETFAGEVYVNANVDTDLFTLSLGQDERLNVIRTEPAKKTQDVFMKNQKKQICASRIRLSNNASDNVRVLVKDQIPVSTDKAITVEVTELSEGKLSEESGEVIWELDAEPQKTVELELSYTVTWPKDKRISENHRNINTRPGICPNCNRPVAGKFCPECGAVVK